MRAVSYTHLDVYKRQVLVFFLLYFKREMLKGNVAYDKVMLVMDSVGLGIFTVVGVNTGIRQGFADNTFLLVFVGTITGVGGGLLRDMMAEVPPYIFVKHIYACASIVGAIVCVYTYRWFGVVFSLIFGSAAVILMRYLACLLYTSQGRMQEDQLPGRFSHRGNGYSQVHGDTHKHQEECGLALHLDSIRYLHL